MYTRTRSDSFAGTPLYFRPYVGPRTPPVAISAGRTRSVRRKQRPTVDAGRVRQLRPIRRHGYFGDVVRRAFDGRLEVLPQQPAWL